LKNLYIICIQRNKIDNNDNHDTTITEVNTSTNGLQTGRKLTRITVVNIENINVLFFLCHTRYLITHQELNI